MTDLTTTHLKCLLEKATPGPWEAEDLSFCECCIDVKAPAGLICTADMDDAPLIAHAPELAQEVIRLREELRGLRDHLKKKSEYHSKVELSTDPLDGIELEDNYAEDEISRILGDHDE